MSEDTFNRGEVVTFRSDWLRSVGAFSGVIPFARGPVTDTVAMGDGKHLVTFEDQHGEEHTALASNLVRVSELHKETD